MTALPANVRECPAGHLYSGKSCPTHPQRPGVGARTGTDGKARLPSSPAAPSRPGAAAEALLRSQLRAAGFLEWADYVPQMAWALDAGRGFAADIGFPRQMLLVECVGGAHAAGRKKVRSDTERSGLAARLGYRVLTIPPEVVMAGGAVEQIEEALNFQPPAARAGEE